MLTSTDVTTILGLIVLAYSMAVTLRVGLFSIAPAGLAGVGAYLAGLLMIKAGWSVYPALVAATLGAGLLSALLALPLSRISGIYTSIATLAFVVVATGVENTLDVTGGSLGLVGIPHTELRWLLGITVVVVAGLALALDRSSLGRRLDVIGADPVLATVLGIRIGRVRSVAIVVAGLLAGWVGAIFATSFYVVTPDDYDFFFAITLAAITVVGGAGHWAGPLLGALALGYLDAQFRDLTNWGQIVTGLVMVAVIVLHPDGIAGALRKRLRPRFGAVEVQRAAPRPVEVPEEALR